MARPRQRRKSDSTDSPSSTDSPIQTNNERNGNTMSAIENDTFLELDDDELSAALTGGRARGMYDKNLLEFLRSGRRGVGINLEDGDHEGKKAQSVKTGYVTALEKIVNGKNPDATEEDVASAQGVEIVAKTNPDRVFLVRKAAAAA